MNNLSPSRPEFFEAGYLVQSEHLKCLQTAARMSAELPLLLGQRYIMQRLCHAGKP